MVRRGSTAKFMAGAWVFPGGAVDADDHDAVNLDLIEGLPPGSDLGPWLAAVLREVVEETGLWLTDPPVVQALEDESFYDMAHRMGRRFPARHAAFFANWVTPTMVPVRFDARFFLVAVGERVVPLPDFREVDAAEFVPPAEALRRADDGRWLVPFPTRRTLRELAGLGSVTEAVERWQNRTVERIQPRMRVRDDGALEVVMPGEPGFDDLEDSEPDPEVLDRAARVAAEKGNPIAEVGGGDD